MNKYNLKSKIQVDKDFLNALLTKSWQEIEQLQNQLTNIEANKDNTPTIYLLNNLLTSYYVFAGGLENLLEGTKVPMQEINALNQETLPENNTLYDDIDIDAASFKEPSSYELNTSKNKVAKNDFEPFEYFVDFDDPSGDPISDEELYGN